MGLKDRLTGQARNGDSSLSEDAAIAFYRRKLLEEVDLTELSKLNQTQRRARLERVVGTLLAREGPVLTNTERSALIRQIVDSSLGLGVLEPLLADETVTEIMVNGPNEIYVERDGRLERVEARFADDQHVYQAIDRIVGAVNRRVDESSPMVDARLPSGERVNVIIPPLSLSGPTITIRRFPRAFTLDEMVGIGTLDPAMRDLFGTLIRSRCNVIISGGASTGKTTLLNALSAFIPEGERIISVEDSAELQLQQPHVISLESRPANVEGKGEIAIRDLVRNALRMRPDRILVGEVRGVETMDMLQAMNTGHEGSIATVHANSTDDAIIRLETLASMSELQIPFETIRDQINSAIDVIVQLGRAADGARRITEVAVVASTRREPFRLATIADFEADPIGPDRRVSGHFRHFPLPDNLARRLHLAGEVVPEPFVTGYDASVAPEREAT